MPRKYNWIQNETGQSMVMFVIALIALLGFAGFAVDTGAMAHEKNELQNAADAAVLAAAQDLPSTSKAKATAIYYAGENGIKATQNGVKKDGDTITVTAPYNGDSTQIEVVCKRTYQYSFGRVLGLSEIDVTARAVAEKKPQWTGEALPFLNLDDDYLKDSKIVAWEKTGPGDFESLWPSEYHPFNLGKNDDHSQGYFTIDYQDGIMITKGTVATIKQEVGYIYEQHKPLYIFSISSNKIKEYSTKKLKNKDVIPLADLVLLQVTFDSYDYSGKTLFLTVTGVYDINNGVLPVDFLNGGSDGATKLVE